MWQRRVRYPIVSGPSTCPDTGPYHRLGPPVRLVRRGRLVDELLELVLANVRTPDIRRVDLLAQVAENAVGAERLRSLVDRYGRAFVASAFDEVIAYAWWDRVVDRPTDELLSFIVDDLPALRRPAG